MTRDVDDESYDRLIVPMSRGELMRQHEFECERRAGIEQFGSDEAWRNHLNKKRVSDIDRKLARIITGILKRSRSSIDGSRGFPNDKFILRDIELSNFFCSVAASDGWLEERERVEAIQRAAAEKIYSHERILVLECEAIYSLIPQYRGWGRYLMDKGIDTGYAAALTSHQARHPESW